MPTLQFKGKTFVQNHHLAVPFHQLVPQPDKSLTDKVSLNDNLIIHGDNLTALKALLPTYAGKVKCIYIDPPYNTGNEGWVYNDNVKSPLIKEWIGQVVGKEGEDLVRHDKWLCMMMPRLKLLRDLLSDDGVLFVSIDDNEVAHLRVLLDEIFGGTNFITDIVWKSSDNSNNDSKQFSIDYNHTLVFSKNPEWLSQKLPLTEEQIIHYKNPDNDPRGPWFDGNPISSPNPRPNLTFPIKTPSGKTINPPENGWRWSEETLLQKIQSGEIRFTPDETGIRRRTYLNDNDGVPPSNLWDNLKVTGHNRRAKYELKTIFPEITTKKLFNTPKPTDFIKQVLRVSTSNDDIILDSFAGSGTTAQAVLELNEKDGGNRKFILVECEDYADNVTAERVRRVIKGVPSSKKDPVKNGLGGTFSFFKIGDAIEMESLLAGRTLPSYEELGRYLFYTATGDEFKQDELDESLNYVGKTDQFDAYMFYKPELEYLKTTALTLDTARALREKAGNRPLLVFAPTKYVEQQTLDELNITFCQLPFEIYRLKN